ncbi:hypothetical protein C8R45DRAFT_1024403 [Mycena sanguinolenta]|nr:hypothetical protein C8R45DRAFT_1024403 [Mycena sanguinolenta]
MVDLADFYREAATWIRPVTGQLCVALSLDQGRDLDILDVNRQDSFLHLKNISLDDPNAETMVISSLDGNKYHEVCSNHPIVQPWWFSISPRLPISHWLTVSQLNSERGTLLMITKPLDFGPEVELAWRIYCGRQGVEVLPTTSWTRYDALRFQAYNLHLPMRISAYRDFSHFWLAQANYVFSQLQTTSDLDDYVLLTHVIFDLRCFPNPFNSQVPEGYLFVCPAGDFQTEENSLRWPDCPAYWSLDPSGNVPLTSEDAKTLGFPMIHIETMVGGYSWDESVYKGIRQFHAGKGFNPDSQDLAKNLGYPLFKLATEKVPPLEYVEQGTPHCNLEDPARCQALGHYL